MCSSTDQEVSWLWRLFWTGMILVGLSLFVFLGSCRRDAPPKRPIEPVTPAPMPGEPDAMADRPNSR